MMQDRVGIVREEEEMVEALVGFEELRDRARRVFVSGNRAFNPGWHTAVDLGHLLTVGEAITRAALERRESRGAHFRSDYPDKDPAAASVNIVIKKGSDGTMETRRETMPAMPAELQAIVEEMK